jgi:hypothetical protein
MRIAFRELNSMFTVTIIKFTVLSKTTFYVHSPRSQPSLLYMFIVSFNLFRTIV